MLIRKNGSDTAIVVLHEIYGINLHIREVCNSFYQDGYDVYCPNLLNREPFSEEVQEQAYLFFNRQIGFEVSGRVMRIIKRIRPYYVRVILLGYSIGATLAWLCSESGLCDCVICCYGSRIRDYLSVAPQCPALLIFARYDSFGVQSTSDALHGGNVTVHILQAEHGFLNPYAQS